MLPHLNESLPVNGSSFYTQGDGVQASAPMHSLSEAAAVMSAGAADWQPAYLQPPHPASTFAAECSQSGCQPPGRPPVQLLQLPAE